MDNDIISVNVSARPSKGEVQFIMELPGDGIGGRINLDEEGNKVLETVGISDLMNEFLDGIARIAKATKTFNTVKSYYGKVYSAIMDNIWQYETTTDTVAVAGKKYYADQYYGTWTRYYEVPVEPGTAITDGAAIIPSISPEYPVTLSERTAKEYDG